MKWYENKLSNDLDIKYPIIQAPMASAASIELASEVSNAGGLGSLGLDITGGVAWFAHVGGFIAGIMLHQVFKLIK